MRRIWILLVLLVPVLAGCHLADAIDWFGRSPAKGEPPPAERVVGAIPGAAAGNPIAWGQIAAALAGFIGVAVAGRKVHKHVKARRAKKQEQSHGV